MFIWNQEKGLERMDNHTTLLAKFWAFISYGFSGGLVAGDILNFLNENYGAVGAFGIVATFLLNWYYKRQEIKILKQSTQQD